MGKHPISQHSQHPTCPTSHIFNNSHIQHPTFKDISHPQHPHSKHTTSPTFNITLILSSLSTNFWIHASESLNFIQQYWSLQPMGSNQHQIYVFLLYRWLKYLREIFINKQIMLKQILLIVLITLCKYPHLLTNALESVTKFIKCLK